MILVIKIVTDIECLSFAFFHFENKTGNKGLVKNEIVSPFFFLWNVSPIINSYRIYTLTYETKIFFSLQ